MNEDTGTCMTPEQAMRAENAELRAENERLQRLLDREAGNLSLAADACVAYSARIAELEAALTEIHELLSNYRHGKAKARAAAALKGDADTLGLLELAAKRVPGHSVEISWHGAPPDVLSVYWNAGENEYTYWTNEWRGEGRRRWCIRISRAEVEALLAREGEKE